MITYNNKDILKSFIGNKRVIKKYLNNKIVYGIPDFAQYYNIQGYDNYEVVGNLTIINGIASGFSLIDYCKLNEVFAPGNNVWEEQIKFKLSYPGSNILQALQNETKGDFRGVKLEIETNSSSTINIKNNLSSNGTSWNIVTGRTSGIPFDYSKWGYILVKFTGTQYIYQFKQEGEEYTTIRTVNNSSAIYQSDTNTGMSIGCDMSSGPSWVSYFRGEIDLKETYIKVNGEYWFNGNSNYKELLDCNPNVYLQNNNNWNAYIDTEIIPSKDVKFKISAQLVDTAVKDGALFGCRKSSAATTSNFLLWYNNLVTGYGAFNYGMAYQNNWSPGISDPYQKQTYLYNGNDVYINDVLQTDGYNANKSAFNTDLTIYLFGYRADNILQARTFRGRVYNFKFWDGDTLIQHLVPVPAGLQIGSYKVPSNGMFDIVEQKFYANAGSGEFIWGVDL